MHVLLRPSLFMRVQGAYEGLKGSERRLAHKDSVRVFAIFTERLTTRATAAKNDAIRQLAREFHPATAHSTTHSTRRPPAST
ncbi:hypothetical protein BOTU111922_06600 [Bordetella tumulicola]